MCFSASASFAASGALAIVGAATIYKTKRKNHLPLAFIPIIFSVQQFIEGLLWISLVGNGQYAWPLTMAFAFFALLVWPAYIPLVSYWIEDERRRKYIIGGFCVAGFMFGLYIYSLFLQTHQSASIVNHCIAYRFNPPDYILLGFLYSVFTLGGGFISSKKVLNWFCVLVGFSALYTWYQYEYNYVSVWCFFGAILSLLLYFHVRTEKG